MPASKVNIKKELKTDQSILFILSNTEYNDTILDVMKQLTNDHKICYVTTNKTYDSLKEALAKKKVNMDNFTFIDAISKTLKKTPDRKENAYFVTSPAALTELSLAITKLLQKKFDYFIFDSITNLLIYQSKETVTRFISSIINRVKQSDTKAVFYAINVKEQEEVIKEVSMFVDNVIQSKNKK
jgi:KaiC/GvpD/RAD55 family RecA-like ATPase